MTPAWFRPWMLWLAAVGVLALLLGLQALKLADERRDHAATRLVHADYVRDQALATTKAIAAAREEEQRRTAMVQETADDAQRKLERSLADGAATRSAGERLRKRVAELTAAIGRGGPQDPAAAAPGAPGGSTADLLADVQRRIDEAADQIADYADGARIRGEACERIHDGLSPPAGR